MLPLSFTTSVACIDKSQFVYLFEVMLDHLNETLIASIPRYCGSLTVSTMTLSGVRPEKTKPRFRAALTRAPSSGRQAETQAWKTFIKEMLGKRTSLQ